MPVRSEKFRRALERNLYELQACVLKRRAFNALASLKSRHSLDFFRVSSNALENDLYAHAHRAFDRHKDAASFWYIERIAPKKIKEAAATANIDLQMIHDVAKKLAIIRDKTHFHIDKAHVEKPAAVWKQADITGNQFIASTEGAHELLRLVNLELTGRNSTIPSYDGSDIGPIIRAYKKAHPDVHIAI